MTPFVVRCMLPYMPITRREFLTKLVSASVVMALPASLIPSLEASPEAVTVSLAPVSPYPKLTLAMLEQAYQMCSYGYEKPDLILMAPDVYAEYMTDWVTLPDSARFIKDEGITLPYFNGAAVTFSKAVPKGSWLTINSKGLDPRLSGLFSRDNLSWRPIPT